MKPTAPTTHHEECRELLPWFVNQTLDSAEHKAVLEHLETCGVCLDEVEELRSLQEIILSGSASESEMEPFELEPTVGRTTSASSATTARFSWRNTPSAVRWLIVAQAASLLLLAALLSRTPSTDSRAPSSGGTFTVLSSPQPEVRSGGRFTVVFRPEATEPEIRRLLLSVSAEIVGGPSKVGAYSVQVTATAGHLAPAQALTQLRSDPLTRLVEPQGAQSPSNPLGG